MKRIVTMAMTVALATPLLAQQTAGGGQMAPQGAGRTGAPQQPAYTAPKNDAVPPADPYVDEALKTSPRHGEWVDIKVPGGATPIKSYVVYPVRTGKAGDVIVVHEIFGMT